MIRASVLAALIAAGITASTPEADIKRAYFKASKGPLSKTQLPLVIQALNGDQSVVVADDAADAASTSKPKTAAATKEKKEVTPRAPKTTETGEQALARLKADPATSARWNRVQEVLEMGKRGPTRIRIVCDDKGANGETITRDIKVQDLFQVKFSVGYKAKRAAKPVVAESIPAVA